MSPLLSSTAANEWGQYGITVNVINPVIETDAYRADLPDPTGPPTIRRHDPRAPHRTAARLRARGRLYRRSRC